MPEVIFDNCVLSNFALSDSFAIIKRLYSTKSYITDFVYAENTKGILRGYRGLTLIREAVKEGWLKEISIKTNKDRELFENLSVSLGFGEASSIAIAKAEGFIFACDDRAARKEAEVLGIRLTGTIGILLKAVKKKMISQSEADEILRKMIKAGFYSPLKSVKEFL
jgi:predicted nucleic acid-binding protein